MTKLRLLRPVPSQFPISSPFGKLRPKVKNGVKYFEPHWGVDIACPVGTPIRAPRIGAVQMTGWQNPMQPKEGFGLRIVLRFVDNDFGPIFCYLAHLSDIRTKMNAKVSEGDIIGFSGNTGSSTGPHLHLESRIANTKDRLDMEFYDTPVPLAAA